MYLIQTYHDYFKRTNQNLYGNTKQAIPETICICKDRNILKEYLENKEQEVIDIIMTLFDDEQILKAYTKDIEDNKKRNRKKTQHCLLTVLYFHTLYKFFTQLFTLTKSLIS